MFQSIPSLRDVSVDLVARDSAGEERVFGPRLPGLRTFTHTEKSDQHYVFLRMTFEPDDDYVRAYVRRAAEALHRADPTLVEFSIRFDLDYTRDLRHIRRDGILTKRITKTFGPYPIYPIYPVPALPETR
jgi:hypothetical protein